MTAVDLFRILGGKIVRDDLPRILGGKVVPTVLYRATAQSASTGSAPAAPAAPSVTAGDGSITATWVAPANNGSAITSYQVVPYSGGVAGTVVSVGNVLTTTITGLNNGQTYQVKVRATNANGSSAYSLSSATVTPAAAAVAATAPATPAAPTVTPGAASIVVSWVAPANGGAAITGYDVQSFVGATGGTVVSVGNVLTTTLTGLTNGTAYTVKVRAKNSVGSSAYSTASASVTPTAASGTTPPATTGTTKPGASNTGVPAGTVLTAYTGPTTITGTNVVIDSKDISGGITIAEGASATITKCKIHGDGNPDGIGVNNLGTLVITDCEIYSFGTGIVYENFTATRINFHGMTYDTAKISSNSTIQDSWIHDPQPDAGAHWDGSQVQNGVVNVKILRNNYDVTGTGSAGGTANTCLFLCPDLGPSTNGPLIVDGNWFDGGNFSIAILDGANGQYFIRDIYLRNNIFGPNHSYGYVNCNVPINQSGNKTTAGAALTF